MFGPFSWIGWAFSAPVELALRGRRWYHAGRCAGAFAGAAFAACWTVAPMAIWRTMGPLWTLLWLLPTTIATLMFTLAPAGGG